VTQYTINCYVFGHPKAQAKHEHLFNEPASENTYAANCKHNGPTGTKPVPKQKSIPMA